MANDISIVFKAKDNYSSVIEKMRSAQTAYRKDVGKLEQELAQLRATQASVKVELSSASAELKEAQKQYALLGDEASKLNLINAQSNFDNIKDNLKAVSDQAKQTQKDIRGLSEEQSKYNNSSGMEDLKASAAKQQLTQMLGESVANAAGTLLTSAVGSDTGNLLTSIASSTATGAATGTLLGGAAGTAAGAAIGAISGAIEGITSNYTSRDSYFKSAVSERYSQYQEEQAEALSSGSTLAASRETAMQSFSTLFGSKDTASGFLEELKEMANTTPFLYDDLTGMAKTMKAYGYEVEDILPTIQKIGDAGAALGMGTDDMNSIATYLGRMKTTGKTTLEYLNPIMERGIPVFDYLSQAMGKTNEEVQEMLTKGLIPGEEAAEIIADYMGASYSGAMVEQSKTFEGLTSTLQGMEEEMDAAMGEGYNEERKKGLQAQIDWYQGEGGKALEEANRLIGVYEASLVNDQEAALRTAMEDTMASEEFQLANEAEKGAMLAEAKAKAEAEYTQTEGYQMQLDAQEQLVAALREALAPVYADLGYDLGQEMTKGIASVYVSQGLNMDAANQLNSSFSRAYGHAYGLNYVPYDNFPTLLHEGERVLTAGQAREADANGVTVSITGNTFTVREEADIDRIADALCERLQSAQLSYVG